VDFDAAHDIAMELANQSRMEAIALTYYFEAMSWTASFSNAESISHVEIRDVPMATMLAEIETNSFARDDEDSDED
jgi:hypothetical protein